MRILMVSMFSNHFFNWAEQLRYSGHEIYWIDVFDSNTYVEKINFVHQIIGWRNRVDYPGRYLIKNHFPKMDRLINKINQKSLSDVVDRKIQEIKPDVIQTFVMQSTAVPLAPVIKKYPKLKWIYSAWGNDLYFRQTIPEDLENIKNTLPKIDFMFADCDRDAELAKTLGFEGKYLGTFPGGGGYEIEKYKQWFCKYEDRKTILIKGYQGKLGRCSIVLEAISNLKDLLSPYDIYVFGATMEAINRSFELRLSEWKNFTIVGKITHLEVMKKMGEAKIYIGNNISDGMPNTLLEAIVMGAFPIQSNPGGATAEIIIQEKNGLLINHPENASEIEESIRKILDDKDIMKQAFSYNYKYIQPNLEREKIKKEVQKRYLLVETSLATI